MRYEERSRPAFRVVTRFSDGSGYQVVYPDTMVFDEAVIARRAASNAEGQDCLIIAVDVDDKGYCETLSALDIIGKTA